MRPKESTDATVAFIFARAGSKGVSRKNLRCAGGKPLLAHSICCAKACPSVDRVIVSTEDEEIADVAAHWGADVPFIRPAELARDDAPEWLAWQHAVGSLRNAGIPLGTFLSIPPTSPLRAVDDIENCLGLFSATACDLVLTATPANRSPYFNMVSIEPDQSARLIASGDRISRRQDTPRSYNITTVAYVARPDYVLEAAGLWDGDVRAQIVPTERSLDIDNEWDLKIADWALREGPSS